MNHTEVAEAVRPLYVPPITAEMKEAIWYSRSMKRQFWFLLAPIFFTCISLVVTAFAFLVLDGPARLVGVPLDDRVADKILLEVVLWLSGGLAGFLVAGIYGSPRWHAVEKLYALSAEWESKAQLLQMFPPDQARVDSDLENTALILREEFAHLATATKKLQEARLDSLQEQVEQKRWNGLVAGRLDSFWKKHDLVRRFAPHINLLESWAKYVELYNARVDKNTESGGAQ